MVATHAWHECNLHCECLIPSKMVVGKNRKDSPPYAVADSPNCVESSQWAEDGVVEETLLDAREEALSTKCCDAPLFISMVSDQMLSFCIKKL